MAAAVAPAEATSLRRRAAAGWRDASPAVRWSVLIALVAAAMTAPIFWRLAVDQRAFVRGTNDLNSAKPRISDLRLWPFRLTVAHPVYLIVVKVLWTFLSWRVATTLVGACAVAGTVVVLTRVGRSAWDDRPPLRTPLACSYGVSWVVLETVAVLVPRSSNVWGRYQFSGSFARGSGYIGLHLWGTPTVLMATPFAFWSLALLLQVVREAGDPSDQARRRRRTLLVLTIFLTLLMPAPALVLAPAICVHLLWPRRDTFKALTTVVRTYVVPAALVVVSQVVFLRSDVSKYEQARWLWKPFWVWHYFGLDRAPMYLIYLIAVPCLLAGARDYVRDEAVRVTAIAIAIGVVPFLFLQQTTVASIPDGDLGVPPLMAVWLFVMSSLRFLLLRVQAWWEGRQAGERAIPPWLYVAAGVVGLMLACGVIDLLGATGVVGET